jgi:hypothetical protein
MKGSTSPLEANKITCGHEGEMGFIASSSYGFIQNESDPRCIHCAWNELHETLPEQWRLDRISFLLGGWSAEVASPHGEVITSTGRTPAAAMDKMREQLKETNRG